VLAAHIDGATTLVDTTDCRPEVDDVDGDGDGGRYAGGTAAVADG